MSVCNRIFVVIQMLSTVLSLYSDVFQDILSVTCRLTHQMAKLSRCIYPDVYETCEIVHNQQQLADFEKQPPMRQELCTALSAGLSVEIVIGIMARLPALWRWKLMTN